MKTYTDEELQAIIESHLAWLHNKVGIRADLRDANLRGADLRGADLRGADLRDANL
uniref:pentapeptide repeat-containing protein n=1 Tax=Leptospira santarosai TaxID=28183 RepID=UPI001146BF60